MYYLLAILMFSFLIFIHEFGHFITAKLSGVQVNEFSMFMGPAIWKKQKGETLYSIRLIPIGGYCAMEGEDDDSDNPRAFGKAKWWKRLIILVAGAAMNFSAGFLLFWGIAALTPTFENIPQPVITGFYEGNTIDGEDGLRVGDEFYRIDGERVYVSTDISMLLSLNLNDTPGVHDIVVLRDGEKVTLKNFAIEKNLVQTGNGESLMYGMKLSTVPRTFFGSLDYGWSNTMNAVRTVRLSLQMLFSGEASINDVSGPAGIVSTINNVAEKSATTYVAMVNVVNFSALIAVNLAVMNLLPVPALDGGRAVCLLLTTGFEAITKKKLNPKYEGYLHGAGMVVLLAFMALITFKDIFNIFRG